MEEPSLEQRARDLAAFGASDAACYKYPGEDQLKERAAYCEGAAASLPKGVFPSPTDSELLGRAVQNARSREYNKGVQHFRWVAVKDVFALGAGYSQRLCVRFGFDPDEMVKR